MSRRPGSLLGARCSELCTHDWEGFAKAPLGGPVQVLDYLARAMHRVPISNERIVALDAPRRRPDTRLRRRRQAHGAPVRCRVHRPLPHPRTAAGFQAHLPSRAGRTGAQAGPARRRAGRPAGAPARAGGGRVLQAHRSALGARLFALRPRALRRRRANPAGADIVQVQGIAVDASRSSPPKHPADGADACQRPPETRGRAAILCDRLGRSAPAACLGRPTAIPPAMQLACNRALPA